MDPLNPFFAVIIFLIAFLTGYLIKSVYKIVPLTGRYECIDGMRGFLALSVFIHHSSAWGQSFQTEGKWVLPSTNLYTHFGQTSVSFFFMITSFLFISKLLNSKGDDFNWKSFFISRIFRLVPMYYFSVLIIFIIIMSLSNWQINVGMSDFFASIFNWLFFTIYEISDINNKGYTSKVNGGVQWSLWYEWLFYFTLPLISIFILKIKPKIGYIVLSVIFIIIFYKIHGLVEYYIYPFIGGAIAPILLKFYSPRKINDTYSSIIILVCLFLIGQFDTANNIYCTLLITTIFTLIALGGSLFGLLKNSTLKFLGEISYSTYLLHGILLYSVFCFGFNFEKIDHFSHLEYCMLIFSITPALVLISFLGFKYIEKPFIEKSKLMRRN